MESKGSGLEDFIMWLLIAAFESARPQEVQQEQVDLRELSFSFWTWRSVLPNPVMKQWD